MDNEPMKPNGMPLMEKQSLGIKPYVMIPLFMTIPLAIGFGIACAIYYWGNHALYNTNMEPIMKNDTYWVYLALVVVSAAISHVNLYPAMFKQLIMKTKSGNLRANMFIYKQIGEKAMDNVIVMETEGDIGRYNRANRSMHHMVENMGGILAGLLMCGMVFPFPTFVIACLWSLGRIAHQFGYTTGYGSHGAGFAMSTIASVTLSGLCLIVFLKGVRAM